MQRASVYGTWAMLVLCAASAASEQPPAAAEDATLRSLAMALEHEDYDRREAAQKQLTDMGLQALPLLFRLESHPLITGEGKTRLALVYGAIRANLPLCLGDERRATTLKALNAAKAEVLSRIGIERLEKGDLAVLFRARTLQGINRFKGLEYLVALPGEKDHEVLAVLSPELWRNIRQLILCGGVPTELRWTEAGALKTRKLDDLLKDPHLGTTKYEAVNEGLRLGSNRDVSAFKDLPPDDIEVTMLLRLNP